MAFGLGILRLAPDAFWRLSPRELEAALIGHFGPSAGAACLDREVLHALMQSYPDCKE